MHIAIISCMQCKQQQPWQQGKEEQPWQSPLSKLQMDLIFKQEVASVRVNHERNTSCSLYRQDYQSLLPQVWLRTQAIDLIMKILHQNYVRQISKIYASKGTHCQKDPYNYVKVVDAFVATIIMTNSDRAVLQSLAPLELFSAQTKYLIIPVNTELQQGQHWVLALLRNGHYRNQNKNSQIYLFDSGWSGEAAGQTIKVRLQQFMQATNENCMAIKLCHAENTPKQNNSYDCGIFAVGFCEYALLEMLEELEEERPIKLDRLWSSYKYLLSNSSMARQRYRRMLQAKLLQLLPK